MRKILFAGATFATLLPGLALAADMPVKPPPLVPLAPWIWTGFYVGGNVDYSWRSARTDVNGTLETATRVSVFRGFATPRPTLISDVTTIASAAAFASGRTDVNGWLGGAQAGYNWQSGQWVFGIEADIQATSEDGGF